MMFDPTYMGADWATFEADGGFEDVALVKTYDPAERTVRGGRCTSCEREADQLLPAGLGQRICGTCWDAQMDLLVTAANEGYEGTVFGTVESAVAA